MRTLDQTTEGILNLAATHFRVPREKLSADDDFFKKLGIDSLQALDMLTRLEQHFEVELPDYEFQGYGFRQPGPTNPIPIVMLESAAALERWRDII
jgi:acyl carrier protein